MSGAASEPSLIYLLACVAGVRKERGIKGKGKEIRSRDHALLRA